MLPLELDERGDSCRWFEAFSGYDGARREAKAVVDVIGGLEKGFLMEDLKGGCWAAVLKLSLLGALARLESALDESVPN
ncbi:hypothetical protein AEQ67_18340 [Pseudomonas sp. RIT-PI-q]|nr:hypothetical protein AEQ67_18340 [Pseudomonas sp. RIT-PI-q]